MSIWSRGRARVFTSIIASQLHRCGKNVKILPPFRSSNLGGISLGEGVIINQDCWILTVGQPRSDRLPKLEIGPHCEVGMGATISAAHSIVLGGHVLLARNVYISDHGHAYEDISRPVTQQGISAPAPVAIGSGCWLGQNAVILPGVTIGEHCVIGANSVVNRSIPSFSVAVGAPARVVKQFDPTSGKWTKSSPSAAKP